MHLAQLLQGLQLVSTSTVPDVDVSAISYDSRTVQPGHAFFALKGTRGDGHDFLQKAFDLGAVVAFGDQDRDSFGGRYIRVADARRSLGVASHRFFGDPSRKLRIAAVTGTAGKTTTCFLLESILRAAGRTPAVLGTVCYRYAGKEVPAPLTTPQSTDLARMFDEMVRAGVDTVAMEVTSHGLTQHRVGGCHFHAAAFTNLSREHLDFHADMEEYFQSKKSLFCGFGVGDRAAFNLECEWAMRARRESPHRGISFGLAAGADITARDPSITREGIRAELVTPSGAAHFVSPLMGRINLMNILCAASLAWLMDVPLPAIAHGIASVSGVPGRMQEVGRAFGRRVIVDYSHKVDSMVRVLAIARTFTPGRLIIVFGCGGDRDRGKRPLMGKAAAEGGDVVIITSDNPRSEDPLEIMRQIVGGLEAIPVQRFEASEARIPDGTGLYTTIEDRQEAIRLAVRSAGPEDTVLICGKGHETYQIVGEVVRHFDDREEAVQALQQHASGGRSCSGMPDSRENRR